MFIPTTALTQASAGSFSLITDYLLTLDTASFDFISVPATYKQLFVLGQVRATNTPGAGTGTIIQLRFNNDSGNNYYGHQFEAFGTGQGSSQFLAVAQADLGIGSNESQLAGRAGVFELWIPNYAGTTFHKQIRSQTFTSIAITGGNQWTDDNGAVWSDTSAINRVTIFPAAGSWLAGSRCTLYGLS